MTPSCRLSLLGAEVDAITPDEVMDTIAQSVVAKRRMVIANHNLHSLYLFHRRADMRAFYDKADLIEIDSTPMILWGRLLGKDVSRAHRCTYLDFRESFWAKAQSEGWHVYHVGGAPEHNPRSRAAILKRYPNVRLSMHTGYFDVNGSDNTRLLADLADKKPDVLLVGMGMPRQELWILNNLEQLPDCAIMPIGAAFDYEAGVMYTPPRWTGRVGLEWLVRFLHEPKRLFSRYFLEPWVLIPHVVRDLMRRRPR
ncbi:WecB/TagA/CpsF family glycosyltransferase [Asticcacaulis machinosus]|uniref:WecB/TagA/CpsF family glycosyltransferase n=1 Tax=Asticcacaulis machinosus TaxID=2984211 RepID=A0ABT5HL36_9CAUL|nr:WecB/TagA/CpsF family glycosyltransferase [Asticcacaulis machinosus]MDC7676953.1 WecB/TagA/CpsF family glycosyltransferase [Asticcacaulis machinosus]